MTNLTIEMEGLDEVLGSLDDLKNPKDFKRALEQCCALVERSAKQMAPKDTGALRQSITSEVKDMEGIIFTPLYYAPYVEFGTGLFAENGGRSDVPWWYQDDKGQWHKTSGQHPQPFMRPALDENREKIIQILREAIANG